MAKIIDINSEEVTVADDSGKIVRVPIAMVKYSSPRVNDQVQLFRDGKNYLVTRDNNCNNDEVEGSAKSVNKHLFVWLGCFLFGWVGVDRHMRGQHGLGILKLFTTTIMPILCVIFAVIMVVAGPLSQIECHEEAYDPYDDDYSSYVDDWDDFDNYDDYASQRNFYSIQHRDAEYSYECDFNEENFDTYMEHFFQDNLFAAISFVLLLTLSSFVGGIWCLVDWIISLIKAYGSNNRSEQLHFDERGHYLN